MKKAEIERIVEAFGSETERWRVWMACGQHDVAALPEIEASQDRFCPNCGTIFSDHSALNAPKVPPSNR